MWTGTGFVAAADAVLEPATDCTPYLHTVSPRLVTKHGDLLLALGVRHRVLPVGGRSGVKTVVWAKHMAQMMARQVLSKQPDRRKKRTVRLQPTRIVVTASISPCRLTGG